MQHTRFPVLHCLLELAQTHVSDESVMPSNHLFLCHLFLVLLSVFPASGSFPMSQLFILGNQRIGASALASLLPMNIQGWFPLGLTGLISLFLSKGLSRVFSNTRVEKHQSSGLSLLYGPTLTLYIATGKTIALTVLTFDGKVMSLLFKMLSRFVIVFLRRSKHILISWLQWFWSPRKWNLSLFPRFPHLFAMKR